MPEPLGLSFLPPDPQANGGATGATPVQQAIQLLALHLPRILGAASPIPPSLLQSLGGGGLASGAETVEAALRRLLTPWVGGMPGQPAGMGMPTGGLTSPFSSGMGAPSWPAPRWTPGAVPGGGTLPPSTGTSPPPTMPQSGGGGTGSSSPPNWPGPGSIFSGSTPAGVAGGGAGWPF